MPSYVTGAHFGESAKANRVQTRLNVRVAALSWEEGQERAAGRRESLAQGGAGLGKMQMQGLMLSRAALDRKIAPALRAPMFANLPAASVYWTYFAILAEASFHFKPMAGELQRPTVLSHGPHKRVLRAGRQFRLDLQRHSHLGASLYREM